MAVVVDIMCNIKDGRVERTREKTETSQGGLPEELGSDEEEERDRLLYEINRMQSIERASIVEKTGTGEFDLVVGEGDDALDMDGVEDQVLIHFSVLSPENMGLV